MIFSENRFPLFGIMLLAVTIASTGAADAGWDTARKSLDNIPSKDYIHISLTLTGDANRLRRLVWIGPASAGAASRPRTRAASESPARGHYEPPPGAG